MKEEKEQDEGNRKKPMRKREKLGIGHDRERGREETKREQRKVMGSGKVEKEKR